MNIMLVTNNPMVRDRFDGQHTVRFVEGGVGEVLVAVRDLVHRGHRLHTHPLSGNLRPWETPCKTVAVSADAGETSLDDVVCAEDAVRYCGLGQARDDAAVKKTLADYQMIDLALTESAVSL